MCCWLSTNILFIGTCPVRSHCWAYALANAKPSRAISDSVEDAATRLKAVPNSAESDDIPETEEEFCALCGPVSHVTSVVQFPAKVPCLNICLSIFCSDVNRMYLL